MKNELIKLANHLDKKGHHKEADYLDALVKRADAGDDHPAHHEPGYQASGGCDPCTRVLDKAPYWTQYNHAWLSRLEERLAALEGRTDTG